MEYLDIHTHVLPGVDDGAQSFAEAIGMLEVAWEAGTRQVVATPHMFHSGLGSNDPAAVTAAFSAFTERLDRQRGAEPDRPPSEMQIHLGAENYVGIELISAAEAGRVLTLAGSRFLLVEFSPLTTATAARHALSRIQDAGYLPVIAHVERYAFLQDEPAMLEELVAGGCVAQVNASAILGLHGLRIAQLVDDWLRRRQIAVVASDGHGLTARRPELAEASHLLAARYGETTARACLHDNPSSILADTSPTLPPLEPGKRWWPWG